MKTPTVAIAIFAATFGCQAQLDVQKRAGGSESGAAPTSSSTGSAIGPQAGSVPSYVAIAGHLEPQTNLAIVPLLTLTDQDTYQVAWSKGPESAAWEVVIAIDNACASPILDLKTGATTVEFKKPEADASLFGCLFTLDAKGNYLAKGENNGVALILPAAAASTAAAAATGGQPTAAALAALTITPTNPSLSLGLTEQLTAIGTYTDGTTQDLTHTVTWQAVHASSVAAVSATGLVDSRGGSVGTLAVEARSGAISVAVTVTVAAATLVSLAITPAHALLPLGSSLQYSAAGLLSDGTAGDYSSLVTWGETDGSGSATVGALGLARGTAAGGVTFTVTYGGIQSALSQPVAGYVLSTPAGKPWLTLGMGGPATSALALSQPSTVATDASGNVYTAANNSIYQINGATGIVSLYAGTGNGGFSADGTPALSAVFQGVRASVVDGSGNFYFTEGSGTRVRKISASNGLLSTVAGTGASGFSGDGGLATGAQLNGACNLAVDGSGNLYVADVANNRVRKVTAATGIISTLVGTGVASETGDGGAAAAAAIVPDGGVAVDGSGNLYVASSSDYRVRKITAATGVISRFAGTGSFGFSGDGGPAASASITYPNGIAVDASGNLYIADASNQRVRKVTAATGVITTVMGKGSLGFSGDGGPATNAATQTLRGIAVDGSGNVFVVDSGNSRIRKVTAATGTIATFAGGFYGPVGNGGPATSASLNGPAAVAVDASRNLYIVETYRHMVRKVTAATGAISIIAGNGTSGFGGDSGPASGAVLSYPNGVAVDAAGNIYICDTGNYRVRMVSAITGVISTVAGSGTYGFSGDGGPATGAELSDYVGGIAVDGSGNLYIADTYNDRVRIVRAGTGVISTVAGNGTEGFSGDGGPAVSAEIQEPTGIAVGGAGDIYFVDNNEPRSMPRVRKVAASTAIISTVAGNGSAGFSGDNGLATSAAFAESSQSLAIDASGNVLIADSGNQRIRKITAANGEVLTIAGTGNAGYLGDGGAGIDGDLNGPSGIAVDASGSIYVADSVNNLIRRLTP